MLSGFVFLCSVVAYIIIINIFPFCVGNITNVIVMVTDLFGMTDSYLCIFTFIIFNGKGHTLLIFVLLVAEILKGF